MQKYYRSPVTKVSFIPYPKIGRALSGINPGEDDMKMITILISIIGIIKSATLAIDLKPNKIIKVVIAIKIRITISKSIFGKYIKTKLSAKILITKAEIIRRYIQTPAPKIFLPILPVTYSQISTMSLLGKRQKIFEHIWSIKRDIIKTYIRFSIVAEPVSAIKWLGRFSIICEIITDTTIATAW